LQPLQFQSDATYLLVGGVGGRAWQISGNVAS
jgi:hypothetical protein